MTLRALLSAGAVVLAVGVAAPAFAQSSASGTANSSLTILRPITVTKNADLRFGTVVRPATGSGTAVVAAATGARTVTGGVVGLASGDTPTAAQFTVDGEGGQAVTVTIPATFTIGNGTDTLTVTTSNNLVGAANAQALSNALGAAGTLVFRVGGSVPVAAASSTGLYTGSFSVTAAYN